MPGFCVINCPKHQISVALNNNFVSQKFCYHEWSVFRCTSKKFLGDKIFENNDQYIIILEGAIFNKKELISKYKGESWSNTVCNMIREKPQEFCREFRGMFSGAVLWKEKNQWLFFTDPLAQKSVFYYCGHEREVLVAGSELSYVCDILKQNELKRTLNEDALSAFLSYGSFLDDSTGLQEVKRIYPGKLIIREGGKLEIRTYHKFNETPDENIAKEDAINRLNTTFRAAVQSALDKNEEYGYINLMDVSGGADSRMILFTARALQCKNALLLHYSQSDSEEERISHVIAQKMDFPYVYFSLDDALFMKDIDKLVQLNSGTAYYCGITGGQRALEELSGSDIGIEFTGLLGNMVDGGMCVHHGQEPPSLRYGNFIASHVQKYEKDSVGIMKEFHTNDLYWLYTRGMLCGMSTFLIRQNYCEPYTPYGDVDFIQAWLSIPWEKKVKDKILLRWMQQEFPDAMKIDYASTGMKLSTEFSFFLPVLKFLHRVRRYLKRKLCGKTKYDMNPVRYWEKEKTWLITFLDEYYKKNLDALQNGLHPGKEFVEKVIRTYEGKGILDKYIALTVLSYCKNFAS